MAINIQSTKDVANDGVKALVYGESGIGKTTLMGTLENQIILSAESGLLALQDRDIDYIEINTLEDIYEAYNFLHDSDEAKKYETIGLDSISEIGEVVLTNYKKNYPDARKAYGDLADDLGLLIRKFRDIKGKNVIFSAKQVRITDDDTGVTTYMASMPGKNLLNGLPYFFDEVFFMTLMANDEGVEYRVLKTGKGFGYHSKDRSGTLNSIEEPNLGKIFAKIRAGKTT